MTTPPDPQGIHLMAKPVGPLCNLDCSYCFYLDKKNQFPVKQSWRMSDETLRAYVRRYIAAQPTPVVEFTWQGGEPTLMGIDFFRRAVACQKEFAGGKTIRNTLQTNGTLLDDDWCAFLAKEGFMVGLSLDGPPGLNDLYRPDKQGKSSFAATLAGLKGLQAHGVDLNVLVTVAREVARQPLEVYRFLKGLGITHLQFNPVVERIAGDEARRRGQQFASPPVWPPGGVVDDGCQVTEQTVEPLAYGDFLSAIFDEWVRNDVGSIHVMNFEWALASWCQLSPGVCLFEPRCGRAAIVEHDGSVYSCDHFMFPEYRLGNVGDGDPAAMLDSARQQAFGDAKESALPEYCRQCAFLFACHGECPKNRFARTPGGEPGLNYLCPGYKRYFGHITQAMNAIAKLLAHGRPAAEIMQAFKGPLVIPLGKRR